eukprot:TRINITY_DN70785_c1_g1_i1.p1 TRINITY_DN70785_c1_g1~~TRINITY_DN70785_c1_g1_i1.p1  ORF type:complete len:366 (+),score=26.85 TRINITY_DN70785_c1_g1_i1:104-1099(+)
MIRRLSHTRKLRKYKRINTLLYIDKRTLNYYTERQVHIRRALHADSWYPRNPISLKNLFEAFITPPTPPPNGKVKAIISPHAGYTYCADIACQAYSYILGQSYKRVIVMGPAHRASISGCGLTKCVGLDTPLGELKVDSEEIAKLSRLKGFQSLTYRQDEEEHSIEMQLPLLKYMLNNKAKIVPIVVGDLREDQEKHFGEIMAGYFEDDDTLFVVSSDFCHWGLDFDYMYYKKEDGPIYSCIERLDRDGMKAIESGKVNKFYKYMKETENTICGRHPIAILLHALEKSKVNAKVKFVGYKQSTKVEHPSESSVSYAAGYVLKHQQQTLTCE